MRASLAYLPLLALPVIAAYAVALTRPSGEVPGQVRERAIALVNAGQQISAAQAIYSIQSGRRATDIGALVAKGNLQVPAAGSQDDMGRLSAWNTDGRTAYVSLDGDVRPLCAELARQASGSRSGQAGGVGAGDQYGCEASGSGARFVFRVQ
jgi:hypothetical protein